MENINNSNYSTRPNMPIGSSGNRLIWTRHFESLSMDDLQMFIASGELTASEKKICMDLWWKRLYSNIL